MPIGVSGSVQNSSGQSTDIFSQLIQTLMNKSGNQTQTPNENPLFTMFREQLLPAISAQYADAQKPVYGDADIARNSESANQTFNTGMDSATQALARRGALSSGAATSVASNLGAARAGNIANFNSSIPFLNEQAKFGKTQGLLGLAANFLGQSPLGQTSTYQDQQTGSQNTNSTNKNTWDQSSTSFGGGLSFP